MKAPIDWLLEDSDPAVRYRTLTWLLERAEADPEVRRAKKGITADPSVQKLFAMQDPDGGFLGKGRLDPLVALADCGVTGTDPRIRKATELIYSRQTADGGFKSYFEKKIPCAIAEAVGLLLAFGQGEDERTAKGVEYLLSLQRLDGGWLHGLNTLPGGPKESEVSCPHATLHALWAVSHDEELKNSHAADRALEFVLKHWETKLPIPDQSGRGFGIGSRFVLLKYPLIGYHILVYASILARYHRAQKDERLQEVARTIFAKQQDDGRFQAESMIKVYSDLEFGRKNESSKWITLYALKVAKQVLGEKGLE